MARERGGVVTDVEKAGEAVGGAGAADALDDEQLAQVQEHRVDFDEQRHHGVADVAGRHLGQSETRYHLKKSPDITGQSVNSAVLSISPLNGDLGRHYKTNSIRRSVQPDSKSAYLSSSEHPCDESISHGISHRLAGSYLIFGGPFTTTSCVIG